MRIDDARSVLLDAEQLYRGTASAERVRRLLLRLDEPLRVAIVGRVKSGKSTLLNALIGDRVAPTDQGECTRIITWYEDGHYYRFRGLLSDGHEVEFRAQRQGGALVLDLAEHSAGSISQLIVTWPSQELRRTTLIDTPGLGSTSEELGYRTRSYLTDAADDFPADAVIYLIRNLHEDDVDFLEAFRHGPLGVSTPINAIAVLSRADEFGGGAPDAMGVARRRAANLTKSPVLRPLVQTVVPVAGLLAESSATFRQSEFEALKVAAALPPNEADELLLSAERFVRLRGDLALPSETRLALLRRLGLYGVRLSIMLLRKNRYASAGELADELRSRSGIEQLKSTLDMVIQGRRDLLKSYATLVALGRALREHPLPGSVALYDQIALLLQSSPILEELDLLTQLRDGSVTVPPALIDEIDRLAGGAGPSRAQRLGLEPLSRPEELDEAALRALHRWRTLQAHPLTCGDLRRTADIVARACESLIFPESDAAAPREIVSQSNTLSGSMPISAISGESAPPAT